jgi:hypothetical protein
MTGGHEALVFGDKQQRVQILQYAIFRIALGEIAENLRGNCPLPVVTLFKGRKKIVPHLVSPVHSLVGRIHEEPEGGVLPGIVAGAKVIEIQCDLRVNTAHGIFPAFKNLR